MTRKALISRLSDIRSEYNCFDEAEEPTYRVLSEAIKALSQEPIKYWIDHNGHVIPIQQPCDTENCKIVKALIGDPCKVKEPCDDAISRADVLKLAEKGMLVSNGNYKSVCKAINDLLPVTPSRHKGHWIYDETLENWRCSKCNETPKTIGYVGTADFMAEHFKFCNHCGAKMESEG